MPQFEIDKEKNEKPEIGTSGLLSTEFRTEQQSEF